MAKVRGIPRWRDQTQRHERRKRGPIGEGCMAVIGERKDVTTRVRKPKEKMYSAKGTNASRAGWAEQGSDGWWGGADWRGQT
jgi:hypothetical protein